MRNFGIPEPHKPRIDPSEFDDPFFGGEKKEPKPNVYMELGEIAEDKNEIDEAPKLQHGELTNDETVKILFDLERRITKDPEIELTQLEANLVYQVDKDTQGGVAGYETIEAIKKLRGYKSKLIQHNDGHYEDVADLTDTEIRQLQDYEQVKSLIIERLRSEKNVIETSTALLQVAEGLGLDPIEYSPNLYMQTLKEKMKDWEERGIFDYLTIELIKNNSRHNIVPVPNNPELGEEEIVALAKKFGEGQPFKTWADDTSEDSIFRNHRFDDQMHTLSGYDTEAGTIRLSLIPTKFSSELGIKTAVTQRTLLLVLQAQNSELKLKVPSLLEAIAHWYTLRNRGDKLDDNTTSIKTYIRHIDLLFISRAVISDVSDVGVPLLLFNDASRGDNTRLSVG